MEVTITIIITIIFIFTITYCYSYKEDDEMTDTLLASSSTNGRYHHPAYAPPTQPFSVPKVPETVV